MNAFSPVPQYDKNETRNSTCHVKLKCKNDYITYFGIYAFILKSASNNTEKILQNSFNKLKFGR